MLRRQPTRVEVSQVDRDELDAVRKEKAAKKDNKEARLDHLELDRNLPNKNARLGLPQQGVYVPPSVFQGL
jgi:hypothetical protein